MIKRDCAYCMDLDEYGALCDNAVNLSCGEPVDARCDGCRLYERRLSTHEMLEKIHSLESKLRESDTWRRTYEDMVVPLKVENYKLRELLEAVLQCCGVIKREKGCDACPMYNWHEGCTQDHSWCKLRPTLHEYGFEVDDV